MKPVEIEKRVTALEEELAGLKKKVAGGRAPRTLVGKDYGDLREGSRVPTGHEAGTAVPGVACPAVKQAAV